GLDDPNYAITYTPGTLTVTPAPLTISAENASKVYGQPNPDFTATYSGLVNRDSPADLGTLLVDTAADAASSVGSYSVTPYGLDETNYDVTYLPATLVVAPAPLTVTADNASRLYGQANPAFTATFTGLVSGDIPASLGTLTFRCAATPASLVGSYPITPLGIDDPNYAVTYLDATLSVSPALLTVTAKSATRAYGLPNSAFSGDFAGLVNDDTPSSLGTLSYFTVADGSSPAGTYAVMPSGLNDTNYAISYQAGTLTVTPAPLTVTVDSASKLYGQPLPTFSATDSGLVNGDTPASVGTLLFSTTASAESPTGDFAIAASGLSDPNYNVTYIAGTLRVVAAPLTVMVDDVTKLYGQPNPGFTATFTGLSNSDTPALLGTLSFETPAQASSAVGTYPVIASGLNDPDYAINYQPGNLSVDPALLTVTTDDSTKVYGAATPPFTASFAGLAAGDVPADLGTVSFFTPADDSSTPGEYPVTPFGLGDPNYAIVYRAGRLTVTPRVLNVTSLTVPATEGTPFAGLVATFSDESPAPVDRYSAEIHWGDGHVSPGTITYDPSRQIFNVVGTNTFGTAGSFATDVQIDFDAAEASTTGTAIVTGAPLVVSVRNLPVTTGVPFQGIVATFSDAGTPRDPSEYSATISWGDGQVSAGTIRRDDGTLTVSGGNTFGAEGVYAARVVVLANGGGEGTASGLAVVTDAALTIEGIPVSASTGEPFHGIVARFDVADDSDSDSDFSAAVDWGDGITTPAKVSQTGPRSFVVVGTHAYTAEGSLHAAVTVTGPDQVRSIADVPTTISSFVTLTPVVSDSDLGTVPPVLTLGPIGGSTPPSRVLSFSPTAPMPFAVALILGNGALGESPTTPASGVTATASTAFSPSNPALAGHSRDGNPGISDAPPVAAVQAAFSNVVESTSPRLAVVAAAISGNGTNVDVRTALPAPSQPPALAGLIAPPDRLWEALDNIEKQVAAGHPFDKLEEVIGVGAVAYVGYVLLHARGGYVLLSLLTSRPLWSEMDPLAVLSDWEKERKRPGGTPAGEEEETLQSLIEGNRDREDADADHGAHQPGSFQPYHQHLIRRPRPRATARPRGRRAEGTKGPV
ncbi:MAG: MBG domain-containing protein, partial [Isosphaeraceae bacterium]|nr:MBG domain-containing protein [Isosphaeraceae bacterium]